MARAKTKKPATKRKSKAKAKAAPAKKLGLLARARRKLRRIVFWTVCGPVLFVLFLIIVFSVLNPPTTHTIWSEGRRLGDVDHEWVGANDIAPVMLRSVVAAEDANFCHHWGFDVAAIKLALEEGSNRGASTITQQTVKNVFLWQKRSWFRKAAEALITPVVEIFWSKRRILEVYLNIAEFDEGVFGVDAASMHYFGVVPAKLTPVQAARLASVLPSPKKRSASNPPSWLRKRAGSIADGAATIRADGRAACFED
ncbi:monofunctional biosynthetic peptidoglycan transglycosylase [Alphaproteobacteria bacterium KMM 3653]|uniref:Biosynthetic peptidoglycan transglycosylase n=1 Tax=Harenicola maris TaxID=2841044 RepID=A0AAP2CQX9_9RHOB|nr:monofunctional biosynthetic peptidoglycan transglycosylase [Harenicola maris]